MVAAGRITMSWSRQSALIEGASASLGIIEGALCSSTHCWTDMRRSATIVTRLAVGSSLALFVAPTLLFANAGLPMVALYLPPAWLLLVPVVGIETLIGTLWLGLPPRPALVAQSWANGFSTLLGVPFAWTVLAAMQLRFFAATWRPAEASCLVQATAQALWVLPPVGLCPWVVPVAAAVAGSAFFLLSAMSEYWLLARLLPDLEPRILRRWVLLGNAASYVFLGVLVAGAARTPWAFEWVVRLLEPVAEAFAILAATLARLLGQV